MALHVHDEVLKAANQIASRGDGTFSPEDVVRMLGHLNANTVRTHVVSRCCVNARKHHPHKWPYFRRMGRAKYRVEPKYRQEDSRHSDPGARPERHDKDRSEVLGGRVAPHKRDTIHAIIQKGNTAYVAECLEVAVVTQGNTLDEVVDNLQQALALHLEDEDLATLGLTEHPRLQLIYDMALAS